MVYVVRPAVFVPTALSVVALVASLMFSRWCILSIPFIWLGAICAAPNLNLADGCLAYVAMIVGFMVAVFFKPPVGEAIIVGTLCSYYMSVGEKNLRARPVTLEEEERFDGG
jgi:hypothetical protein